MPSGHHFGGGIQPANLVIDELQELPALLERIHSMGSIPERELSRAPFAAGERRPHRGNNIDPQTQQFSMVVLI